MEYQFEKPTLKSKIKNFFIESKRVLRVTKKPTMEEFKTIVKISSLGIAIIGIIGFIIQLAYHLLR